MSNNAREDLDDVSELFPGVVTEKLDDELAALFAGMSTSCEAPPLNHLQLMRARRWLDEQEAKLRGPLRDAAADIRGRKKA